MLGKLLKYELQATGRVLWPVYAALVVLGLFGNISARLLETQRYWLLNVLGGLVMALFVTGCIAACVITLVQMVQRFRSNLMGDEGYVMFTLPVNVHQQLWAKLLSAFIWFVATALVVAVSIVMVAFRVSYVTYFVRGARELFSQLTGYYAFHGAMFALELLGLLFLSYVGLCLMCYAAIAIGHSFSGHKTLLSVAFFFLFVIVLQILGITGIFSVGNWLGSWQELDLSAVGATHIFMGGLLASSAVCDAVFYFLTAFMLKRHLNLE